MSAASARETARTSNASLRFFFYNFAQSVVIRRRRASSPALCQAECKRVARSEKDKKTHNLKQSIKKKKKDDPTTRHSLIL